MTPQLMVLSPGAMASIQDLGRFGYRRIGVPQSGVMHSDLMWVANALAGNHKETFNIPMDLIMTAPQKEYITL